jgi:hypothetical protein
MRHERFELKADTALAHGLTCRSLHVSVKCKIRVGSGEWRDASVRDLSVSGFSLLWPPGFGRQSKLRIRLGELETIEAVVRESDGAYARCELAKALSPYVIEHLLKHAVL